MSLLRLLSVILEKVCCFGMSGRERFLCTVWFVLRLVNLRSGALRFTACFAAAMMIANSVYAQSFPITTDSRIKTLIFNENEVYQLKFHYGYQSFIEFSPDEEVEIISIGEAFPWRLTPAGHRLFIRALEIDSHTNMTIITTKRTYQFDISSGEHDGRADEELIYSVRFFYPNKQIKRQPPVAIPAGGVPGRGVGRIPGPPVLPVPAAGGAVGSNAGAMGGGAGQGSASGRGASGVSARDVASLPRSKGAVLNFDYSMAGLSENIAPLKVYDDGRSTYMQFPNNNLIIPSVYGVDLYGNESPLEYRIDGDFVVIDNVELQFALRLSDSLVCVFNNTAMHGGR